MTFSKAQIAALHVKLNAALKEFADANDLVVGQFPIRYSATDFSCTKVTFTSKSAATTTATGATVDPRYAADLRRGGLFVGLDSSMIGTELVLPGRAGRNDFTFVGMRASKAVAICKQDGKPYLWDAKFMSHAIKQAGRQVKREPSQEKLDAAFSDLLSEIAAGKEYPDAIWTITQRHKVPSEAMQEMYDAHYE